jgi:hypothetical protein
MDMYVQLCMQLTGTISCSFLLLSDDLSVHLMYGGGGTDVGSLVDL